MGERENRRNPKRNPFKAGKVSQPSSAPPQKADIDFSTQRICPACGKVIKLDFNFCKFCGVDLSEIEAIGDSDQILKQLAIAAVSDPEPEVREEAVDTMGNFGEKKVLGVLTYILLNDPDEKVRKQAADELGDIHHPISLNVLSMALKDSSPKVRKEVIEGLKKIKKKNKPKEFEKKKDRIEKIQKRIEESKSDDEKETENK